MSLAILTPELKGQGSWTATDGVYSNAWAGQPLLLFCGALARPERHELQVTAANWGSAALPANFTDFEVDVYVFGLPARTESFDLAQQGPPTTRLKIPAALTDQTGSVVLDLPAAASVQIVLVWRNDVYQGADKDANLRVSAVKLVPVPRLAARPELKAAKPWTVANGVCSTTVAGQPLHVFCGALTRPERYALQVTAANFDSATLPANYTHYELDVYVSGYSTRTESFDPARPATARLKIPAALTDQTAAILLDLPAAASVQLVLVWRNDAFQGVGKDANLRISAVNLTPA